MSRLRHVVDFCYPPLCPACDEFHETSLLCPDCRDELQKLHDAPACRHCAMPVQQHDAPCPWCRGESIQPIERIARLGNFADPIRGLIHQMKYRGRWPLAEFLADELLKKDSVQWLLNDADFLVPVPLHPWRRLSRGYNQAEVLARRIGKRKKIRVSHPVVRLKNTDTQTHLHSKTQRYENLRDAFGLLHPRALRNRHVILIDDVMTTGATLTSVAKVVKEAEPASIGAIVVAVADPHHSDFEKI